MKYYKHTQFNVYYKYENDTWWVYCKNDGTIILPTIAPAYNTWYIYTEKNINPLHYNPAKEITEQEAFIELI